MRRVLRTAIFADGGWHDMELTGPIIHVATRREDAVEIWHIDDTDAAATHHAFIVVGTGHPLSPAIANHIGSAITPSGHLVWHLFEHERPGAGVPADGERR